MTRASGAERTGLDRLIELTAAGAAADAFVAVALAGSLFFSTSVDQARGRIALTLIITMAPFAVLAPLIGPMLDRVRDGRRYILIGTLLARGLLCWGMAGAVQHNDTVTLLPAAFGVLVLQKAYGVTRSAVTPRLLPARITLVSANARISLAALIASTLGAAAAAGVSFAAGGGAGGATWALRVGTAVYLAAIALGIRLPDRVDEHQAAGAYPRPAQPGAPGYPGAPGHPEHRPGTTVANGPGPGGPYPGPADSFPGPGGRYPGPAKPFPGPAEAYPGTAGAYPGTAASYPGAAGPYPATAGTYPQTGWTYPQSAGAHPGQAETLPGSAGTPPGSAGSAGATGTRPRSRQQPRRAQWAVTLRRVGPIVGEAMRGNAALRAFSGYMIFFLAFLLRIEHFPGVNDKLALAEMIAAAGAGGFIGTAVGAAVKSRAPHLIMFTLLCTSTVITALCAAFFGLWAALIVALVAAFSQVLAKLSLDSIVQREIPEDIRSSTLAASETIHQLAWVGGGLAGLAMSFTSSGVAGLAVAAGGLAATSILLLSRRRRRILAARHLAPRPGPLNHAPRPGRGAGHLP
jgi:hypothetical protein